LLLLALTLVVSAVAEVDAGAGSSSQRTHAGSCAGAVSWTQAGRVLGRVATVRGLVAGTKYAVGSNGSPTFLDIGAAYPSSRRVTAVIWQEDRAKFGRPEARYLGRTICVRGRVHRYAGVPEITVTSPSQIGIAT
jgi:hypothetical protein